MVITIRTYGEVPANAQQLSLFFFLSSFYFFSLPLSTVSFISALNDSQRISFESVSNQLIFSSHPYKYSVHILVHTRTSLARTLLTLSSAGPRAHLTQFILAPVSVLHQRYYRPLSELSVPVLRSPDLGTGKPTDGHLVLLTRKTTLPLPGLRAHHWSTTLLFPNRG